MIVIRLLIVMYAWLSYTVKISVALGCGLSLGVLCRPSVTGSPGACIMVMCSMCWMLGSQLVHRLALATNGSLASIVL